MEKEVVVVKERPVVRVKPYIIFGNAVVSVGLALIGLFGMIFTDRVAGAIYEWSTLIWVLGLVSFWLIPIEILLIRSNGSKVASKA